MYYLMYLVIASATCGDFLSTSGLHGDGLGILPSNCKFLCDVLSIVFALYIVVAGTRRRFDLVSSKYWLLFGALSVVLACGIIVNQEAPGPIINGMRYYLRPMPFFFLPAVLKLSDKQIRNLLRFILVISFLQVPVSAYQRYSWESVGATTGDVVMGTLMDSGPETLFLICVICVLAAAMLRGLISKLQFGVTMVILFIPMSINETKVTIFLFPPALLATFLAAAAPGKRTRVLLAGMGSLIVGMMIFIPVYNFFETYHIDTQVQRYNPTLGDFLTRPGFLFSYISNDAGAGKDIGHVGRLEAVTVPLQVLSRDPVRFAFGFGMGNASASSLGGSFVGRYFSAYGAFATGFDSGVFLLETGIFGFALIMGIHATIFRDALVVAKQRQTDLLSAISIGWVGASIVVITGIFYIGIHGYPGFAYCYWFLSGLIAARRTELLRKPVPQSVVVRPRELSPAKSIVRA
jgi:hypothetical protein